MHRHTRNTCKIANSEEGMQKLMDHTIQKQLEEQKERLEQQNTKINELTALIKQMGGNTNGNNNNNIGNNNNNIGSNNSNSNNTSFNTFNNINIRPFGGPGWLIVPVALVKHVFTSNQRLNDYCKMNYMDQADPEKALPYVIEGLMEILRGEHADPMARNVYLNPKRVDQVMVFVERADEKTWEVRTLPEVTRMLFDGVTSGLNRIIRSHTERAQLPFELHGGVAMMPQVYESVPEFCVKTAKGSMAAYLSNIKPPGEISGIKPDVRGAAAMPTQKLTSQEASLRTEGPTPPVPTEKRGPSPPPQKSPDNTSIKEAHKVPSVPDAPKKEASLSAHPREAQQPLTPETAAAALCAKRPKKAGEVDAKYIKALQDSIVPKPDLGRLVTKLWEAKDDGLLNDEDAATASAICTVYDMNPNAFLSAAQDHKM